MLGDMNNLGKDVGSRLSDALLNSETSNPADKLEWVREELQLHRKQFGNLTNKTQFEQAASSELNGLKVAVDNQGQLSVSDGKNVAFLGADNQLHMGSTNKNSDGLPPVIIVDDTNGKPKLVEEPHPHNF